MFVKIPREHILRVVLLAGQMQKFAFHRSLRLRVMSLSLLFFGGSVLLFLISPLPQVCHGIQKSIQFLIVRLCHQ